MIGLPEVSKTTIVPLAMWTLPIPSMEVTVGSAAGSVGKMFITIWSFASKPASTWKCLARLTGREVVLVLVLMLCTGWLNDKVAWL